MYRVDRKTGEELQKRFLSRRRDLPEGRHICREINRDSVKSIEFSHRTKDGILTVNCFEEFVEAEKAVIVKSYVINDWFGYLCKSRHHGLVPSLAEHLLELVPTEEPDVR